MNIVQPYAKILPLAFQDSFSKNSGEELLRLIERAGRVSHRSEDRQTNFSWEPFIKAVVLQHGDWSIVEHASATVEALVDRGITHEWVRHRIGAYTQESTRFVNYEKKMPPAFIMPQFFSSRFPKEEYESEWRKAILASEEMYKTLISMGESPQIARSVFPNALASKLIVTYNLRSWRHFFLMRTSKESHPQMRQVTIPLLEEFKSKIPLLYDDIIPESRQIDNLRLAR